MIIDLMSFSCKISLHPHILTALWICCCDWFFCLRKVPWYHAFSKTLFFQNTLYYILKVLAHLEIIFEYLYSYWIIKLISKEFTFDFHLASNFNLFHFDEAGFEEMRFKLIPAMNFLFICFATIFCFFSDFDYFQM